MPQENLMEKITSLAKRRGFIFQSSEIYGGVEALWDFGPLGVELKNNIKQLWWRKFVQSRQDIVGLDASLIMSPKVWEASGHLKEFSDPLIECKNCHQRFREDSLTKKECPRCSKKDFTPARQFNLMFKTFMGPAEGENNLAYFRPETAQAMFVDFKNILDTTHKTLPFGIAQIGKAFRNEITPGNFIFRTREFEQMEIEYFVKEKDWEKYFEYWEKEIMDWIRELGVNLKNIHKTEIPDKERAHYSKKTIDFEYDFPFGRKELYGLAYRTDFDLKNHFKAPPYKEEGGEAFYPHVIEPTWGVDRSVLVALLEAYKEDGKRVVLGLPPKIAPYKVAVFPLLANKEKLIKAARDIYDNLRKIFMTAWDDRGNIGKRYFSQDEIGTPYCITVDFETLENNDVTLRDRDTMKQERIKIKDLAEALKEKFQK